MTRTVHSINMIQCRHLGVSDINICRIYDDSTLRFIIIFKYVFIKYIKRIISSTSSVLCTPLCIVHTYKCTHINTNNNTLWDICYQVEPLFENFQILESVTFKYLPNGTKNILKKTFDQNCECCCQSSVFEATSINVTNAAQNLLQKCQVNPTKFVSTTANCLVFEATSGASYNCHLLKYDKWYQ